MYIFLDESGDIKGKTSKCFIICGFKTGNKRRVEKEFIKWQRECFPRKLKYQNEIIRGTVLFSPENLLK